MQIVVLLITVCECTVTEERPKAETDVSKAKQQVAAFTTILLSGAALMMALAGAIVELRGPRAFARRRRLSILQSPAVFKVAGDTRAAESMTANCGVVAGVLGMPADHALGIDAMHGQSGQLFSWAGGAETPCL